MISNITRRTSFPVSNIGTQRSHIYNNIALYVISGYFILALIGDILLTVYGLEFITENGDTHLTSAEIYSAKIFLIITTIVSFFLGLIVLISVAVRQNIFTVILGIGLIIFLCTSLRFANINFSLLGLSVNSILTLIGCTVIYLIRGCMKFSRASSAVY